MSYAANPPWIVKRQIMMMSKGKSRRGSHRGHRSRGSFPMGPDGPFGGPFGGRQKVSRGDVRIAILHLLNEEPMHGYQIMQDLSDRTDGLWKPSPGSVYPTLQQLEDEGLIEAEQNHGKRVFELTDEGRAKIDSSESPPPWERFSAEADDGLIALRETGFQVGAAVMQVGRAGSDAQVAKATEILEETRSRIYQILAEDAQPSDL
jgi:DNA-binding PadR family transcriptional regulator